MSQQRVLQMPQHTISYDNNQTQQQEEIALQRLNSDEERADRRKMRAIFNSVSFVFFVVFLTVAFSCEIIHLVSM